MVIGSEPGPGTRSQSVSLAGKVKNRFTDIDRARTRAMDSVVLGTE